MNKMQINIRYTIDASDCIESVCGGWDRFAVKNDAPPELLSGSILNRSFWDFISGDTAEHVYRRLLTKVRSGKSMSLPFRCDSPSLRRFLTVNVAPTGEGGVKFETEIVCTEEREFQPLFCKEVR